MSTTTTPLPHGLLLQPRSPRPWRRAKIDGLVVEAFLELGRFRVRCDRMLDLPPDHRFFQGLRWLSEASGWSQASHQQDLLPALLSDWEPAHIYVALNLDRLARFRPGGASSFLPLDMALWEAMREARKAPLPR